MAGEHILETSAERGVISLWVSRWVTPHIITLPGVQPAHGMWLKRTFGHPGWGVLEEDVPTGEDSFVIAKELGEEAFGLEPKQAFELGTIAPEDLPGVISRPTDIYLFDGQEVPTPSSDLELGFFPIGALPEQDLQPRYQGWLDAVVGEAFRSPS
jgi:hypothetical protein